MFFVVFEKFWNFPDVFFVCVHIFDGVLSAFVISEFNPIYSLIVSTLTFSEIGRQICVEKWSLDSSLASFVNHFSLSLIFPVLIYLLIYRNSWNWLYLLWISKLFLWNVLVCLWICIALVLVCFTVKHLWYICLFINIA